MTTIDDLRRALDERAATASDGAGMADRARTGANRIGRRRRVGVAAVACLVAAVAAVVPSTIARLRASGPPAASVITPYRGPGQMTVRPSAGSQLAWKRGTDGFLQYMTPGNAIGTDCCAEVRVYDPGTYDARVLEQGERISVGGHPAFYASTRIGNGSAGVYEPNLSFPTVGWQDRSGAWVTVVGTKPTMSPSTENPATKASLAKIASDVQLGAPQDLLVPMHFPAVPRDLPITFAEVDDLGKNGLKRSILGFGGNEQPWTRLSIPSLHPVEAPLRIEAWTAGISPWTAMTAGPVNTTVAGHPARYYERTSVVPVAKGGSVLLVEIGSCGIQITVQDRTAISRQDLEAMFAGATFDECDSTKTWTRPFQ